MSISVTRWCRFYENINEKINAREDESHFIVSLIYFTVIRCISVWQKLQSFICDALRDLVPFVQFKKCKKHPWRSVTLKPTTLLKVTLLHGCLSRFLNCRNGTKPHNASHIVSYANFKMDPKCFQCFLKSRNSRVL